MTADAEKIKKKKKKRSPAMVAAIVLVVLLIVLMLTLAFLTSFDEVTNVFDSGRVDIILTEENWKPEKAHNIVPETVLDKDPKITNNEHNAVYVFLEVKVPYDNMVIEGNTDADKGSVVANGTNPVPMYKFIDENDHMDSTLTTAQNINSGWMLLGTPEQNTTDKTYTYLYAHVREDQTNKLSPLGGGVTTGKALFNRIKLVNFNESYYSTRDYSVRVKAYGIQANFLMPDNQTTDDPQQVWNILNS